ncbi:uncharacterized protein LOC126910304 [Daktulosphaira vitifoliae]|uniref:uncharacterized protein LOC126910304 n=1 Tax=Daktulosphaira vitifoliae TaxID=58002 RepID=UPI0021AA497B|nr:uncharacterized protein LOC126910304 [Daktulosphaira vitifoliae]
MSVAINTKSYVISDVITDEKDIGKYLIQENIDNSLKFKLLRHPWVPNTNYNFKSDFKPGNTRAFRNNWLHENSSWLTYSAVEGVKGAFCRVYVLFKPSIHRGVQGNAKYSSHRTQNELITLCSKILKENIVCEASDANAFSIIADETADISGVEQLTIVIRFLDKQSNPFKIREEFLGFLPLNKLDSESVATQILSFMVNCGLDLTKLCGQGYYGCATMAGKESGVAKLIRDRYAKALFFHCANHRLNLVINDLNKIMVICNTTGTIKEFIKFYRESKLRRKLIPNIPLFCETRWSSKYKSIRVFSENFITIIQSLQSLSINEMTNANTRQEEAFKQDEFMQNFKSKYSITISLLNFKYTEILKKFLDYMHIIIDKCQQFRSRNLSENFICCVTSFIEEMKNSKIMFENLYNAMKFLSYLDVRYVFIGSIVTNVIIDEIDFFQQYVLQQITETSSFDLNSIPKFNDSETKFKNLNEFYTEALEKVNKLFKNSNIIDLL